MSKSSPTAAGSAAEGPSVCRTSSVRLAELLKDLLHSLPAQLSVPGLEATRRKGREARIDGSGGKDGRRGQKGGGRERESQRERQSGGMAPDGTQNHDFVVKILPFFCGEKLGGLWILQGWCCRSIFRSFHVLSSFRPIQFLKENVGTIEN